MKTTIAKAKKVTGLILIGSSLLLNQVQGQLIKYESKDSLNEKAKISSFLIGRFSHPRK